MLSLKKLPPNFNTIILSLFNKSIIESKIPKDWKTSEVTMIPKKTTDLENPSSYRPISMTSCLAKMRTRCLCEKLILTRIKDFLKEKKIIIKQQSGSREHRQTKDNLMFLIQKIQESFARKKKSIKLLF